MNRMRHFFGILLVVSCVLVPLLSFGQLNPDGFEPALEVDDTEQVFVILAPLVVKSYEGQTIEVDLIEKAVGASFLSVSGRMNRIQIRVPLLDKTDEIPLPGVEALQTMNRVELISLRRETGLDGAVLLSLEGTQDNMTLHVFMVDLNRGVIFTKTAITGRLNAELLSRLEQLTIRFCGELSRFYEALIVVKTRPIDALVFLNGKQVGTTPLYDLNVPEGTYTIEIKKAGYASIQTQVTLREFERYEMDTTLDRIAKREAQLMVQSNPEGASVFLDNSNVGTTPLQQTLLSGEHIVRLEMKGKTPVERQFEVEAGDIYHIDVSLYSPLANEIANKPPGFFVDRWTVNVGYNLGIWLRPIDKTMRLNHNYDMSAFVRLWSFLDVGVFLSSGATQGDIPLEQYNVLPSTTHQLRFVDFRVGLDVRWIPFRWPRFFEIYLGGRFGLTQSQFYDQSSPTYFEVDSFSNTDLATACYLGFTFNPIRWNTGAMGISLDMGIDYHSMTKYKEKEINLFGAPVYRESDWMYLWDVFARLYVTLHFGLREDQ